MLRFSFHISLALGAGLSCFAPSSKLVAADETATARGQRIRDERKVLSKTSKSVLIEPESASRFDANQQLKLESSLSLVETGRISPSGFAIPKIRGQDSKLTEVFIENILLSDPYSGLPLVEDLDLRAFGSLEIHQGVSPLDVPTHNVVGSLRYRHQHIEASQLRLGLTTGSPYGHSLWGQGTAKGENDEFRLYARTHQTSGEYRYYSDEATPYNSSDDRWKTRKNNDQRSQQIMPSYHYRLGSWTFGALGWLRQAEKGIPSSSLILNSEAREEIHHSLFDLNLSFDETDIFELDHFAVVAHVGRSDDQRTTRDPERLVLNSSQLAEMDIRSSRQGIRTDLSKSDFRSFLTFESAQSVVDQAHGGVTGSHLQRSNESVLGSLGYYPHSAFALEAKLASHRQWDRFDLLQGVTLAEEKEDGTRFRFARSESLSAAIGEGLGLYFQIARNRRIPSLYEEFGNGGTVRPNSSLKPEELFHREWGVFLEWQNLRFAGTYFIDVIDNKIVVVPILASASKALNVGKTRLEGKEVELRFAHDTTSLRGQASFLEARDLSQPKEKDLPSTPRTVMLGEWRESWTEKFSTHLSARYRSMVYRDLANTVKIPEFTSYDFNADYRYQDYEFGLILKNLLDSRENEITSGTSRGRTGISDVSGAPLPGRQWILNLIVHFKE